MKQIAGKHSQQDVNHETQKSLFIVEPGSLLIILFILCVKDAKMWLLSEKDGIQIGKFLHAEINRIIHYIRFAMYPRVTERYRHTFKRQQLQKTLAYQQSQGIFM